MMEFKHIETEADYDAAVEEVERLFDAEPSTPEEGRLGQLVGLVVAYNGMHHEVRPPGQIEMLRYYVESRGLAGRIAAWLERLWKG